MDRFGVHFRVLGSGSWQTQALKMMYRKNTKKYWSTFLQYFLCWAISWGRWWWDPTSISILNRFLTFKDRGHTSQCCRASQWDGWGRWAVGSCTWTCNEFGRGLVEVQVTKVYLNSYLVFSIGRLAQMFFLLVLVLVMKTCQAASQWARHVELTRWTPCHWMPRQPFGPGGVHSVQSCSSSAICLATGFFQMQKANEVTRYDDLWLWHDTYHRMILILLKVLTPSDSLLNFGQLEAQMATNSAQNVQALARQLNRRQAVQRCIRHGILRNSPHRTSPNESIRCSFSAPRRWHRWATWWTIRTWDQQQLGTWGFASFCLHISEFNFSQTYHFRIRTFDFWFEFNISLT